jgi:signal transduction protein with GAF and PtsI domain
MDLIQQSYDSSSDDDSSIEMKEGASTSTSTIQNRQNFALALPIVDLAPQVIADQPIQTVAVVDPKTKELYYNPKYEELFQSEVFNIYLP